MSSASGAAFGKVILLGEHAVVYGHPALCGALQSGVRVSAVPGEGALMVPAWQVRVLPGDATDLAAAYAAILSVLGLSGQRFAQDFVVEFAIPAGAGLGSSAALSVALSRALSAALSLDLTEAQVAQAADAAERVFHGRPSGLDQTVAQHGGFGLFRRQDGLRKLAAPPLPLCVGLTGKARDTRGRVARVAELHEQDPEGTGRRFQRIAGLVRQGADAVARGDLGLLGQAMNENQEELSHLEVSSPEIDRMCGLARGAGALGAKLTGGGGGGCVIAVAPGRHDEVRRAWREAGFDSFVTQVGGCA